MAFALPCMFIVICYARIFYIVRRTAIRSREPATMRPGISTRTIDRPVNNSNSQSNSNEEPAQPLTVLLPANANNKCDNTYETRRRASSSVDGRDSTDEGLDSVVIHTTSEKRRCLLSKLKDDDLKFIDTSVDSGDNNNYLIRNMTQDEDRPSGPLLSDDFGDERALGNGALLQQQSAGVDKSDSAVEEDKEEESTEGVDAKMTTMNGSQYLAVLAEPSSSSGIDVALEPDEPLQRT